MEHGTKGGIKTYLCCGIKSETKPVTKGGTNSGIKFLKMVV